MTEMQRGPFLVRHEQISEALRSRIRSGEFLVGSRLPTEAELMREFGAARGTVRRALRTLGDGGLVQTLQGKGTYVRSGRPEPSIGQALVGLSESLSYSERSLTTRVLEQRTERASAVPRFPDSAPADEPFLFLDRVRYLDDVPVARLKNWVRLALAPTIADADFETVSLFSALDERAVESVSSGRRTFEAVLPDAEVAESLEISTSVPLLFLVQTTFLASGAAIEYSEGWMDSQHIAVSTNLTR